MDEVVLDGKTYIGSKKAAQECGYTQDYVGQLARKGQIDAQRVSGQWYIFLTSLQGYKSNAEAFKPEPPKYQPDPNVETTINVEGKEYVSAARASKLTEYNQDYVGQLARASKIPSRQVGNRWYVEYDALLRHKKEKDAMLRAVQAESVGLKRPEPRVLNAPIAGYSKIKEPEVLLSYLKEEQPLFPQINDEVELKAVPYTPEPDISPKTQVSKIPIRVLKNIEVQVETDTHALNLVPDRKVHTPENTIFSKLFVPSMLSIVILVAVGVGAYKRDSIYSYITGSTNISQSAAVSAVATNIGTILQEMLSKELVYVRK